MIVCDICGGKERVRCLRVVFTMGYDHNPKPHKLDDQQVCCDLCGNCQRKYLAGFSDDLNRRLFTAQEMILAIWAARSKAHAKLGTPG